MDYMIELDYLIFSEIVKSDPHGLQNQTTQRRDGQGNRLGIVEDWKGQIDSLCS
jgi:hypothetical protein